MKELDISGLQTCTCCGTAFVGQDSKKYCSADCKHRAKLERLRNRERKVYTKTCACCGKTYQTHHIEQITCSKSCMGMAMRKPEKPKKPRIAATPRQCDVCGKEFISRANTTCQSCKSKASYAALDPIDRQALSMRQLESRKCKWCGKEFTPIYKSKHYSCCCEEHALLKQKEGKKIQKRNRKAKRRKAYVAPIGLRTVFRRDKGICQLCGKPVSPNTHWPNRMCASLDHIIPLALGGTHEPKNVQLAHHACNSAKGTKPMHEQLRLC